MYNWVSLHSINCTELPCLPPAECLMASPALLTVRYQPDSLVISPPPNFGSDYVGSGGVIPPAATLQLCQTMPSSSAPPPSTAPASAAAAAAAAAVHVPTALASATSEHLNPDSRSPRAALPLIDAGAGSELVSVDADGRPVSPETVAIPLFTRPPLEDR